MEEDSACLLALPKQQLDASHTMMNKFRGPTDANFELVSNTVKEMVHEAKGITVAQREGRVSPWAVTEPVAFWPVSLTDTLNLAVYIHNEHFMVSRQVNTLFTGRAKEIQDLQQSLCPSLSTNPQAIRTRTYVIYGMGGAGKSEVALKFAYDNRAE